MCKVISTQKVTSFLEAYPAHPKKSQAEVLSFPNGVEHLVRLNFIGKMYELNSEEFYVSYTWNLQLAVCSSD
jgi:hypothetical protein